VIDRLMCPAGLDKSKLLSGKKLRIKTIGRWDLQTLFLS